MNKLHNVINEGKLKGSNIRDGKRVRHYEYDLYFGTRNREKFIEMMEKQISEQLPEVNISDIVEQYYNRKNIDERDLEKSYKMIFKKTLEKEKKRYFNLENGGYPLVDE